MLVSSLTGTVEAYLDPGTGSIVIQAILAGAVGVLAVVRPYWHRLTAFVLRRNSDRNKTLLD